MSSEQVGRSSIKTIKHLGGTQPNLPSVPCFSVPFLSLLRLFLFLSVTDDNSVGVRGHGLTEKGIISCDNHRWTVNNKLAAENNNRHEENFSKAHKSLAFSYNLTHYFEGACVCINAESAV